MKTLDGKWVPFYFEGNMWFGMVKDRETWLELLEAYKEVNYSLEDVLQCHECERSPLDRDKIPRKFGFRAECNGVRNLGYFFSENNIDPAK